MKVFRIELALFCQCCESSYVHSEALAPLMKLFVFTISVFAESFFALILLWDSKGDQMIILYNFGELLQIRRKTRNNF